MSGQPLPEHGVCCSLQPAKDKVDKEKRKPTAYNLFVKEESGNLRKADILASQQVGSEHAPLDQRPDGCKRPRWYTTTMKQG